MENILVGGKESSEGGCFSPDFRGGISFILGGIN